MVVYLFVALIWSSVAFGWDGSQSGVVEAYQSMPSFVRDLSIWGFATEL